MRSASPADPGTAGARGHRRSCAQGRCRKSLIGPCHHLGIVAVARFLLSLIARQLGDGATLVVNILGSITVFVIVPKLEKGGAFALAGAMLTFFGLIRAAGGVAAEPA